MSKSLTTLPQPTQMWQPKTPSQAGVKTRSLVMARPWSITPCSHSGPFSW